MKKQLLKKLHLKLWLKRRLLRKKLRSVEAVEAPAEAAAEADAVETVSEEAPALLKPLSTRSSLPLKKLQPKNLPLTQPPTAEEETEEKAEG